MDRQTADEVAIAKARLLELGQAESSAAPPNLMLLAGIVGVGIILGRGRGIRRILKVALWPVVVRVGMPMLRSAVHSFASRST